jgi:hypothetical protein
MQTRDGGLHYLEAIGPIRLFDRAIEGSLVEGLVTLSNLDHADPHYTPQISRVGAYICVT